MPTLSIGADTIHYVDQGKGSDAILMLHAFPLHSRMWMWQMPALQRRHRIVAPDARGFGKSGVAPDTLTMDTIASDALAVLDHLGIEKVIVCGCSMGGYAAFALHRLAAARVRALVLADTRPMADTPEGRAGRLAFAENALGKGLGWVADEMVPKLVAATAPNTIKVRVRQIISESSPAAVAAAQRGMAERTDSTPMLPGIACPTLCIAGALDALTPPAVAREMASAIPGARFVEVPGAGHLSNLEAPEPFNAALASFLAGAA
ncbi:MAG: alpha/beta fold hydrolase [Acidobacteriota bacterium]